MVGIAVLGGIHVGQKKNAGKPVICAGVTHRFGSPGRCAGSTGVERTF